MADYQHTDNGFPRISTEVRKVRMPVQNCQVRGAMGFIVSREMALKITVSRDLAVLFTGYRELSTGSVSRESKVFYRESGNGLKNYR